MFDTIVERVENEIPCYKLDKNIIFSIMAKMRGSKILYKGRKC